MIDREKVIQIARKYVGYLEKRSASQLESFTANAGANNYTCFARDYLTHTGISVQGQPWCDVFVDECMIEAYGVELAKQLLGGFSAYTPTSAQYFKDRNQWHSTPQKGDVIFFKNSSRICHTGLVYQVSGGKVYTVEGNTSGASGVVANGGGVCQKSYSIGYHRIAGYGRPEYEGIGEAAQTPGQWIQNETGWWWKNPDGTYPANQWIEINGQWYYFDGRGYMANQQWIGDYYVTESGAMAVNQWIGKYFVDASGKWVPDKSSGSDWVVRLQQELNDQFGAGLTLDGIAGSQTLAACPTVKRGAKGNVTKLIQEKLGLAADGIFGSGTESEVKWYQKQRELDADGIVGKGTWKELLGL